MDKLPQYEDDSGGDALVLDESKGAGSTFFQVSCTSCGHVLGHMYTKVPMDCLAGARNAFSFNVARVLRYRLGSADIRVANDEETEEYQQEPGTTETFDEDLGEGENAESLQGRIASLEEIIVKVCAHNLSLPLSLPPPLSLLVIVLSSLH